MILRGKTVRIPIYNYSFRVFITNDFKAVHDKLGYKGDGEYDAGVFNHSKDDRYEVLLEEGCSPDIVVHEVIHLLLSVCHRYGLMFDHENDESIAYLTEFIFKEIWEFTHA